MVRRDSYRLISKKHTRHSKQRVVADLGIDKTSFPPASSIVFNTGHVPAPPILALGPMAVHIHPSSYVVVRLCNFGKVAARVADVPNGAFDRPKLHALYRPKFTRLCMCIRPWFFGEGMADMDSWQRYPSSRPHTQFSQECCFRFSEIRKPVAISMVYAGRC